VLLFSIPLLLQVGINLIRHMYGHSGSVEDLDHDIVCIPPVISQVLLPIELMFLAMRIYHVTVKWKNGSLLNASNRTGIFSVIGILFWIFQDIPVEYFECMTMCTTSGQVFEKFCFLGFTLANLLNYFLMLMKAKVAFANPICVPPNGKLLLSVFKVLMALHFCASVYFVSVIAKTQDCSVQLPFYCSVVLIIFDYMLTSIGLYLFICPLIKMNRKERKNGVGRLVFNNKKSLCTTDGQSKPVNLYKISENAPIQKNLQKLDKQHQVNSSALLWAKSKVLSMKSTQSCQSLLEEAKEEVSMQAPVLNVSSKSQRPMKIDQKIRKVIFYNLVGVITSQVASHIFVMICALSHAQSRPLEALAPFCNVAGITLMFQDHTFILHMFCSSRKKKVFPVQR